MSTHQSFSRDVPVAAAHSLRGCERAWAIRWRNPCLAERACRRVLAVLDAETVQHATAHAGALIVLSSLSLWRGDAMVAENQLREAVDILDPQDAVWRGRAKVVLAGVREELAGEPGNHDRSWVDYFRIEEDSRARAEFMLLSALRKAGLAGAGLLQGGLIEANAYADAHAFTDITTRILISMARCAVRENQLEEAETYAAEALHATTGLKLRAYEPAACATLGEVLLRLGRSEEAHRILEQGRRAADAVEFGRMSAQIAAMLSGRPAATGDQQPSRPAEGIAVDPIADSFRHTRPAASEAEVSQESLPDAGGGRIAETCDAVDTRELHANEALHRLVLTLQHLDDGVLLLADDDSFFFYNTSMDFVFDVPRTSFEHYADFGAMMWAQFQLGRFSSVAAGADDDAFRTYLTELLDQMRHDRFGPMELRLAYQNAPDRTYRMAGLRVDDCRVVTFTDITELRDQANALDAARDDILQSAEAAEQATEQAEEAAEQVIEILKNLDQGIALFHEEDGFIFHNAEALRVFGLDVEDMYQISTPALLIEHLYRQGRYRNSLGEIDETALKQYIDSRVAELLKDNFGPVDVQFSYEGEADRYYQLTARRTGAVHMFSFVDVTDRKRRAEQVELARKKAERALVEAEGARAAANESSNLLMGILENLDFAVALIDDQDRFVFHNDRFEEFWNISPEFFDDHVGWSDFLWYRYRNGAFGDAFPPGSDAAFAEYAAERELDLRQDRRDAELTNHCEPKRILQFQSRRVGSHRMLSYVDVTDLVNARAEAEAGSESKSQFLANMSHEIRTPMNGILGMCQLLKETELDEDQELYVRTVSDSSDALLAIINDILGFSKLEAAKMTVVSEPINLQDTIQDVLALLAPKAAESMIDLVYDFDDSAPKGILSDAGRLRQVLLNVIGNAVKFTNEGYVLVRVFPDGEDSLRIDIEDTGIGIPAEMVDKIFAAFEQVDGKSTRQFEGTGLGLAITQKLVELMGGKITARSQVGVGTTFSILLPATPCELVNTSARETVALDGVRILVVDDIEVNRVVLERQLGKRGAVVTCVASAADALILASEQAFDVCISDFQMPHMDGEQFLGALRALGPCGQFPVVLLSSVDKAAESQRLRTLGFSSVLVKPANPTALNTALYRALNETPFVEKCRKSDAPAQTADSQAATKSILIAEDNRTNRLVVEKMLKSTGIKLHFAENGQEAVNLCRDGDFELILMDISMPVMNGLEACQEIRRMEAENDAIPCPIVALTANAMEQDRQACNDAGMDDFLSKPVRKGDLLKVVEKYLPKK